MPESVGINRQTGQPIHDWDHVAQSIEVILTAPLTYLPTKRGPEPMGEMVMLREFGSEVPELIGRPMISPVILAAYAATANALARWEPRFALTGALLREADEQGRLSLALRGLYLPRGHLGDFTPATDGKTLTVPFARAA